MKWTWFARIGSLLLAHTLFAQLNEHCTVSILNRTAQVKPDGTWHLDNLPFITGSVRARSACVDGGVTRLGQSELFNIPGNLQFGVGANFDEGLTPIPTSVRITAPVTILTSPNQTVALTVTGEFANSQPKDLTKASTGTTYLVSNSNLATISPDGVVAAKATGTVLVQAVNEGAQGLLQLSILLSGDSDGDGIPDDVESAQGLDPNNPTDALDDPDRDGLTNIEEFRAGTGMRTPDTDGDGLPDGQEVKTLRTNPLLKDTDGDGVPDNSEVATSSDPNNPISFNLAAALSGIRVNPASFSITTDNGSFQQLTVTGDFKLGGTIDLTSIAKGTNYNSSNLQVCRFTNEDGRILPVAVGNCVITVTNSGFTQTVNGAVTGSATRAISFVPIPGFGNAVDVLGNLAYVAAGASGFFVVDMSDQANPLIAGALATPGNANDVRVIGKLAYLAAGAAGLLIIDVTNPAAPVIIGSLDTPGAATEVFVFNARAYVGDGLSGISIINVANPAAPALLKQVATPEKARTIDLVHGPGDKTFAVVALEPINILAVGDKRGLAIVDVTDAASASIVANIVAGIFPLGVRVVDNFAYLFGGGAIGTQVIDLSNILAPRFVGAISVQAIDMEVSGRFAVERTTLLDISSPAAPGIAGTVPFRNTCNVTGTVLSGPFVFSSCGNATSAGVGKGTTGDGSGFHIAQYLPDQDALGVLPQVTLLAPAGNSTVVQGSTIALHAAAKDDIAVRSVTFLVNGEEVLTDNSAPYDAYFRVPANATQLTITARAVDLGNNVNTATPVTVTAIADPRTVASGRVVAADGMPVAGAAVVCSGVNASSSGGGQFSFAGLPTTDGAVSCSASLNVNGHELRGQASSEPVVGGPTNLGDIVIKP